MSDLRESEKGENQYDECNAEYNCGYRKIKAKTNKQIIGFNGDKKS